MFGKGATIGKLSSAADLSPLAPASWSVREVLGRLVEVSGNASVSASFGLIAEAHRQGHPCAWVCCREALFFPPDVIESGVDLQALLVVRARDGVEAGRAADKILRSGAFGLVVLDLGGRSTISMAAQARMVKLTQKYQSALVVITDKEPSQPSLSSLVSLRCMAERKWLGGDRFSCRVHSLKDKRRGPVWSDVEAMRGPAGAGDVQLQTSESQLSTSQRLIHV